MLGIHSHWVRSKRNGRSEIERKRKMETSVKQRSVRKTPISTGQSAVCAIV